MPTVSTTVLIVEVEVQVRDTIGKELVRKGFTVKEANTGERGLEVWYGMSPKPHLLICDLILPGISGMEVAMAISRLQPGVKILFISGAGAVRLDGLRSVIKDFHAIEKPFNLDQLLSAIQIALTNPTVSL
jgi:two-component system cell cycle sensor histidine kinase/response regulator CckA